MLNKTTSWMFVGVLAISVAPLAQSPDPPLGDPRLSIHTLVREDIFAGFFQRDLVRLARAERNIEQLLATRPGDRAGLLAWQAGAALTRAAHASDTKQPDTFRQHYRRASDLFSEAKRLGPDNVGVFAITGGTNVSIADRLPAVERTAAWQLAYDAYRQLWRLQGADIDKLPLHHKGEVLAGLAQAAQRTGRSAEAEAELDRILTLLPGTPYATRARQWKDDPPARATVNLACQTCHAPGTLAARLTELSK